MPITIEHPDQPHRHHVFTAMGLTRTTVLAVRWN
jgi:hypothetical protein